MKICPTCGKEVEDGAMFCYNCGADLSQCETTPAPEAAAPAAPAPEADPAQPAGAPAGQAQPTGGPVYQQQYYAAPDYSDHTAEFDAKDISDNKVLAMLPYLLGTVGIIVALLGGQSSPFTQFHVRQALKLVVAEALVGILSVVLCWTFIVPIAGGICALILFVLRIIAFFQICGGKAKEPAIISNLGFLK